MATKLITFTVSQEDDGDVTCSSDFHRDVPVEQVFAIVGAAIDGMIQTMTKVGHAKGMTQEQVSEAMFVGEGVGDAPSGGEPARPRLVSHAEVERSLDEALED